MFSHFFAFLAGQAAFCYILRVKAFDLMVGFNFAARLVFVKIRVEHFAFLFKSKGIVVHSVEIAFFTLHAVSVLVSERMFAALVVLEDQILQRFSIIRAFRGQVFENCHDSHCPRSKSLLHLHYILYAGVDVLLQFVGLRASRVKMPRDLIEIVSDARELCVDFFQLRHFGHDRQPTAHLPIDHHEMDQFRECEATAQRVLYTLYSVSVRRREMRLLLRSSAPFLGRAMFVSSWY